MTTPTHTLAHAGRRYRTDRGTRALLSYYRRQGRPQMVACVLRDGLAAGRIVPA